MAQFDICDKMSTLKENLMTAVGDSDYESKYDAMAILIRTIDDIESRLYEMETIEADRDQYKRWWHEERNKKREG